MSEANFSQPSNATQQNSVGPTRRDSIVSMLGEVLGRLFGRSAAELDIHTPFIELGADSLFLLQASQAMQDKFQVKIPFRLLLEDLSTIDAIADHLHQKLPKEFGADLLPLEPTHPRPAVQEE